MGNALNSFSQPTNHTWVDPVRMETFEFTRTFRTKGLFIIPYNLSRVLAAMALKIEVLSIKNEYRDLTSNPELSFYGYCHTRRFKVPYGAPVQMNLRTQELFWWNPLEPYQNIDIIGTFVNAVDPLDLTEVFGRLLFPAPKVTDFSFGFRQEGQYRATLTMIYWNDAIWEDLRLPKPDQPLPNTGSLLNTPVPGKTVSPTPVEPYSQPYNRVTGDFGESDPVVNPPIGNGELIPFRIEVTTLIRPQSFDEPQPFTGTSVRIDFLTSPYTLLAPRIDGINFIVPVQHAGGVYDVVVFSSGAFERSEDRDIALNNAEVLFLEE